MPAGQVNLRRLVVVRWVIYALMALAIILPFLVRLPVSFRASPLVEDLYRSIDALPPGSHVLLAFDYDPGSKGELLPMSLALLRHCFRRDLVPIVMTHWLGGLRRHQQTCEQVAAESKEMWGKEKLSGRDWVYLGYRPGLGNLVLNMGENLKGAFETDYYGQPTRDMEALKGVQSLKDVDLAVDVAAGATIEMWIAYGADRFNFPLGAGCTAVMAPDMYPFIQSKQLVGLMGGLRGAADYEVLLQKPGQASRGMVAQSIAHVLVIALVLAANASYLLDRIRRRETA